MLDQDDDQRQDYDDQLGRRSTQLPSDKVPSAKTRLARSGVWIGVFIGVLIVGGILLWSAGRGKHAAADRMRSTSNLKQIGLAIHNFNDHVGELPNATYSPDGNPLLSWRVLIL